MFERGGEGRSGGEGERAERDKGGGGASFFLGELGKDGREVYLLFGRIHVESGVSWSYMYKSGMTTCVIQVCFVLLLQCY